MHANIKGLPSTAIPDYETIRNELCRRSISHFIKATMPSYDSQWFHEHTCRKIVDWYNGKGKPRLMIFMPPQHGKSQISTRHTPAWILGKNPDTKIGVAAYNGGIASKFNRDCQRIIEHEVYSEIFPNTKLPSAGQKADGTYSRNNHEFEILGYKGGLVSVGVGGGLTSRQIDIMIIDDIYKDAKEAWSPLQRANVSEWYDSVVSTRLHNDSKVLIVFTRWHEDDLGGELLRKEPDKWDMVKIPAIRTTDHSPYDPRKAGEPLWPQRHNLEKLLDIKRRNGLIFDNLYQQDPQPAQGLLYADFKTYKFGREWEGSYKVCLYCDTADSGTDYLCSVVYIEQAGQYYILDVLYTQQGVEYTEGLMANQLIKHEVNVAYIEANAGGRIFARNVKRVYQEKGGRKATMKTFTQTSNKESRIYSAASLVNDNIIMPENWMMLWPEFHHAVTRFDVIFKKNKHDDAADALTGIVEMGARGYGQYVYTSQ
jgi:predicted phage terminase large subunit-like protein